MKHSFQTFQNLSVFGISGSPSLSHRFVMSFSRCGIRYKRWTVIKSTKATMKPWKPEEPPDPWRLAAFPKIPSVKPGHKSVNAKTSKRLPLASPPCSKASGRGCIFDTVYDDGEGRHLKWCLGFSFFHVIFQDCGPL